MLDDVVFMEKALELAKIAYDIKEIPVGCVIVDSKSGEIVGEGYNTVEKEKNSVFHAEINAIFDALNNLKRKRLEGYTIYVTLEPCPMCCGAIINTRLDRVVFGADEKKSGCIKSKMNMFEFDFNHKPIVKSGILKEKCQNLLSNFFSDLRS